MFKRYWWMLLVMAPVGIFAGFMIASVVTYLMPKQYESSATIEIKPPHTAGADGSGGAVSPEFFGTEFEKIKSRNSFLKVIEKLDLKKRWGMDEYASLQELKRIVRTENLRGTDLISITVRHPNREDARDIAAEVAYAYSQFRNEIEWGIFEKKINEVKKAVREQEDKVEEMRKVAITVARVLAAVDYENLDDTEKLIQSVDPQSLAYVKTELETELSLLEQMKLKLIEAEISQSFSTVVIHDSPVIATSPVSPIVSLNLIIGALGGFLISPFLALPLMWMLNRKHVAAAGF